MKTLKKSSNQIAGLVILLALSISFSSQAAETKATSPDKKSEAASASTAYPEADDIRCEKIVAGKLADFKNSLVENCNLNKPFSSNISRILNDETYFYCCHKRK